MALAVPGAGSGAGVAFVHAIRQPETARALVFCSLAGIFAPPPGALEAGLAINPKRVEYEEWKQQLGPIYTGMRFADTPEGEAHLRAHYEAGRARTQVRRPEPGRPARRRPARG